MVRPTMYLACMDIKSAFDEAAPKHVAKIRESHNTHGWIISAKLTTVLKKECNPQTTLGGEMTRFTEAKTCRGESNVEE